MPTHLEVFQWVHQWAFLKDQDFFKKAFKLCGLVPVRDFNISELHEPLALCYNEETTEEI